MKHPLTISDVRTEKESPRVASHPCKYCKQTFTSRSNLIKHANDKHNISMGYECEHCGRFFNDRSNYKKHCIQRHGGGDARYQCHLCHKRMATRANFEGHMNLHSGIKPFACAKCGNKYTSKKNMLYHERHNCTALET